MWLPEEVLQQLAEVEVARVTQANKYLEELSKTIRYNETPCKGSPKFGSHPLRDAEVEGGRTDRKLRAWRKQRKRPPRECMTDSCLKGLRQRILWAMRQGSRWTRHCSWVPCLAPLRSQEVCHIGPHRKSHKTPCRSCPPNRTCRSRQSAHPYSSVGFASKCMRHPWEGTIHQHTAIWADHRRRTARPVRDCTAIASLVAPCHSGEIQVRTARDCNHHQSCDPQHAMSFAEAAQAMSKEIPLAEISSDTPSPARIRPPPQPKRKVVEKWSLFEALSQPGGRHRPPQKLPRTRRFQKIPHQLPYRPGMQSGAELWQLDAELLGLSFNGPNGQLNVLGKWGRSGIIPALHCFRARMGGTLRLDHGKH